MNKIEAFFLRYRGKHIHSFFRDLTFLFHAPDLTQSAVFCRTGIVKGQQIVPGCVGQMVFYKTGNPPDIIFTVCVSGNNRGAHPEILPFTGNYSGIV